MGDYKKPLPLITPTSKVFYDACKEGKLLYQQCCDCNQTIFFPQSICPGCLSHNLTWQESKGKGRLFSYTITYSNAPPEFASDTPYVLAIVELDEGYKMMTNIVDTDFDNLKCDEPVEVVFEKASNDITLPKFRIPKNN